MVFSGSVRWGRVGELISSNIAIVLSKLLLTRYHIRGVLPHVSGALSAFILLEVVKLFVIFLSFVAYPKVHVDSLRGKVQLVETAPSHETTLFLQHLMSS